MSIAFRIGSPFAADRRPSRVQPAPEFAPRLNERPLKSIAEAIGLGMPFAEEIHDSVDAAVEGSADHDILGSNNTEEANTGPLATENSTSSE